MMNTPLSSGNPSRRSGTALAPFQRSAAALGIVFLGICLNGKPLAQSASTPQVNSHRTAHPFILEYVSMNSAHFCGPGILCIDAIGSANIPHLGKSIGVYQGVLDFSTLDPNTGCGPNPGTVTLTAANGDTLVLVLGGNHCQSTPDAPLGSTSGDYTVSGGTGRFEGATGGGTYRDVNTTQNPDFTGTDTARFEGTLSY